MSIGKLERSGIEGDVRFLSETGLQRDATIRQSDGVAETKDNARRWNGYVCPDCRFIFRVPRDHDGRGVICPNCRRMLKTPAEGEKTPPLVAQGKKVAVVGLPESFQRSQEKPAEKAAEEPVGERKKRRRQVNPEEEEPDWDKIAEQRVRVSKRARKRPWKRIAMGLGGLAVLAGVVMLVQRKPVHRQAELSKVAALPAPANPDAEAERIELPLEMNRDETELLAELEPLTRKFLDATTVEELLPLVRDREAAEPKMRKFYPDGRVPAPGLGVFNTTGNVAFRSRLASVTVRTREFEVKQIAYLRTGEGLKIDWESYVGWSDMPWPEFLSQKPEKPTLFRVSLKLVEYYNFDFAEDRKWQSYQLRSPDGEHVVYGYARRDSTTDQKLRPNEEKETNLVTVLLKFQLGEGTKNQVVIDSVVADGWVEGVGEK